MHNYFSQLGLWPLGLHTVPANCSFLPNSWRKLFWPLVLWMVYSRANVRTTYRPVYVNLGIFQISSRCTFPTPWGFPLPSNNKKIRHNQLSIMRGLITPTGNYLEPSVLPFLGSSYLTASWFFSDCYWEKVALGKGIEKKVRLNIFNSIYRLPYLVVGSFVFFFFFFLSFFFFGCTLGMWKFPS